MDVMQILCFNVYFENEGVVKSVQLRKFDNSELYVFQDVLMSVYFESQFIKLQDIIGFSDQFGCIIPNEELVSFLLNSHFQTNSRFIKICKKSVADISTQTETLGESVEIFTKTETRTIEKWVEISTQTETFDTNRDKNETTLATLKRTNAVLGPLLIVSSEDFKQYLAANKGVYLLDEFKHTNTLKDKSRKAVIDYLGSSHFGLYPTRDEKRAVCHACVNLFPSLKTKNQELENIDLTGLI